MTEQPEALRLAKFLDGLDVRTPERIQNCVSAAAELRRLHQSEREGWRYADELEQDRKRLETINAQLLEALEAMMCLGDWAAPTSANSIEGEVPKLFAQARAAIAATKGEA